MVKTAISSVLKKKGKQLIASCMCHDWGLSLQPRCVPQPGIKPVTFQSTGQQSNQLSHNSQGISHSKSLHLVIVLEGELILTCWNKCINKCSSQNTT